MDNLTHTLVGAALGEAGLKHRSGLAMPALMIAANLPDIDIVLALTGNGLSGRRGWTHGPVGLLILPLAVACALLLYDRRQARRGVRASGRPPVRFGELLLLGYIGILSHPLLDLLNNWGIRFLMPFSETWFYGDALFIADPWIWILLAGGIWLSREISRRDGARERLPAAASLAIALAYAIAMLSAGRIVESEAADRIRREGVGQARRVLASPVFGNPFRRNIVAEIGDEYRFGSFDWFAEPRLRLDPIPVATNMNVPALRAAQRIDPKAADFLAWSRYPFASMDSTGDMMVVALGDARFGKRPDESMIGMETSIEALAARTTLLPPATSPGRAP